MQHSRVVHLTNKEASTVLCDVKHTGSGRAQKRCIGENERHSQVFLPNYWLFMIENALISPHLQDPSANTLQPYSVIFRQPRVSVI